MPRSLEGNASVRMAAELAISIAPPTAWTMRMAMISTAPVAPVLQVADSPMEARVKTTNPRL